MSKPFASSLAFTTLLGLSACQGAAPDSSADDAAARGRDAPVPELRKIGEVQGRGPASPLLDRQVSVQGIVVGNFGKGLGGVFVQSERDDGDPLTAEGLFVERAPNAEPELHYGDRVRVSGRVVERGDGKATLTALTDTVLQVIGEGQPNTTTLEAAPAAASDWERFEGMRLRIRAPLTVTGNNGIASYGELALSFDGRLYTPTEIALPGPAAAAVAQDNARRLVLLDDNRMSKDPKNLWFLKQPLSDAAPVRVGSTVNDVVGVLDQRRGQYRLQLAEPLDIRQAPRPAAPKVAGDVRIASLNMHNYFNGDGQGGGFPTTRGAQNADEQTEQRRKLIAEVQGLNPDIAALMEMENDGNGADSALAQFVAALNSAGPAKDWRVVPVPARPGNDEIRVAMIYRSSKLQLQGVAAQLTGGPYNNRSRVPMAQAFRAGRGPVFVVVANHLKSKGCGRDADQAQGADADQHDGQGCWNPIRMESARLLQSWVASDPTHSGHAPTLLVGDFNAYAMEDPLRQLRAAGWQDAFALKPGEGRPYSFNYDNFSGRLDHALLDAGMAKYLRGAAEWHNNSDEADAFNEERERDGDPWRASDHDPILLGFDLAGSAR